VSYPQLLTPEEKLTDAKARLGIPKIVAICGSTRFMDEMTAADAELTWAGHIVVKPGCDMKQPSPLWADETEAEAGKQRLDDLHRAKIRLADQVLVVGDYIGTSTTAEIAYARELGKPVTFTHPAVDPAREAV
jgi:nucleoside 2-deoxyribosyltransferase